MIVQASSSLIAAGMSGTIPVPGSPPAALDDLSEGEFLAVVAPFFENAPRFLARLAAGRPYGSAAGLFGGAREIARSMPEDEQIELIDAHPRLGAAPATVSRHSYVEQGYDLSEIFDGLVPVLKRLLSSKQSKVTKTQGASIRKTREDY